MVLAAASAIKSPRLENSSTFSAAENVVPLVAGELPVEHLLEPFLVPPGHGYLVAWGVPR